MKTHATYMILTILALVAFLPATVHGQVPADVPEHVKDFVNSIQVQGVGAVRNMMVTNDDFRKFQPKFEFLKGYELSPAMVTEQEAADYAEWQSLKPGVGYIWRPVPRDKKQRGVIMLLTEDMIVEEYGTEARGPSTPEGMVYVPGGAFIMGCDIGDADESPQHSASIDPFYIDKLEVSNAEFKTAFPDFVFDAGREQFPAIVTWDQANAYAESVGKRLPTEAEWEKAARGTDGRMFPWGNSYDHSFVSWDEKEPRGGSIAKPESPYGCLDMAGGAWEWTADWYQPYEDNDAPCDEYGEQFKVIRGGASFNDLAMCRTTHRYYLPQNTTGKLYVGFRCAKSIDAGAKPQPQAPAAAAPAQPAPAPDAQAVPGTASQEMR